MRGSKQRWYIYRDSEISIYVYSVLKYILWMFYVHIQKILCMVYVLLDRYIQIYRFQQQKQILCWIMFTHIVLSSIQPQGGSYTSITHICIARLGQINWRGALLIQHNKIYNGLHQTTVIYKLSCIKDSCCLSVNVIYLFFFAYIHRGKTHFLYIQIVYLVYGIYVKFKCFSFSRDMLRWK